MHREQLHGCDGADCTFTVVLGVEAAGVPDAPDAADAADEAALGAAGSDAQPKLALSSDKVANLHGKVDAISAAPIDPRTFVRLTKSIDAQMSRL